MLLTQMHVLEDGGMLKVCVLRSDALLVLCEKRTRIGPDSGDRRGYTQRGLWNHGSPYEWCTWHGPGTEHDSVHTCMLSPAPHLLLSPWIPQKPSPCWPRTASAVPPSPKAGCRFSFSRWCGWSGRWGQGQLHPGGPRCCSRCLWNPGHCGWVSLLFHCRPT